MIPLAEKYVLVMWGLSTCRHENLTYVVDNSLTNRTSEQDFDGAIADATMLA